MPAKSDAAEQTVLPLYTDMSLLAEIPQHTLWMTDLQLQLGADIRTEALDRTPQHLSPHHRNP